MSNAGLGVDVLYVFVAAPRENSKQAKAEEIPNASN